MSFVNNILKIFVGDKSQNDVKALQGNLKKTKAFESALAALSHDELRAKTTEFKAKIKQARLEKDTKIAALQQEAESVEDTDRKEDIYASIDELEKEAYELEAKALEYHTRAIATEKGITELENQLLKSNI